MKQTSYFLIIILDIGITLSGWCLTLIKRAHTDTEEDQTHWHKHSGACRVTEERDLSRRRCLGLRRWLPLQSHGRPRAGWLRVSSIWQPLGRAGLGLFTNECGRERWWCVCAAAGHYENPSWLIITITDHIVHTPGCSCSSWMMTASYFLGASSDRNERLVVAAAAPDPARSWDTCSETARPLVWWQWPRRLRRLFSGRFQEVSFWQADTPPCLVVKDNSNQSFIQIAPFRKQEQWNNWSLSCPAM